MHFGVQIQQTANKLVVTDPLSLLAVFVAGFFTLLTEAVGAHLSPGQLKANPIFIYRAKTPRGIEYRPTILRWSFDANAYISIPKARTIFSNKATSQPPSAKF